MKRYLKALPLPVCGVMLGLAALEDLLQAVCGNLLNAAGAGNALRLICGILATLLALAPAAKVIACGPGVRQAMQDPVVASVSGTFSMGLMLLSVYWKPALGIAAEAIWFLAIALHIVLIVWFTVKFLLHFQLARVFTSYYIVYVGIAVAAVSAPAYGMESLGAATFWFGFVCMISLLAVVTLRYGKLPVKPLFCIYAAPASLCLAGYVQSVTPKSPAMLLTLLTLSSVLFLVALIRLPGLLKLPFYPSYAAFTFPFVITAIAALQCTACLAKLGSPLPWLRPVVLIETVLAAVLVFYALFRYIAAAGKAAAGKAAAAENVKA